MSRKNWLLVTCIIGMALSAAALILLIPSLFAQGDQVPIWIFVALGLLVAAFAAGTRYSKRAAPTTGRNT